MEWLDRLNAAIVYLEEHIEDEADLQRLAQIAALLVAQAFFADDVRRQGQVVVGLFHARAADDDGGQGGMGRRRGDLGLGER